MALAHVVAVVDLTKPNYTALDVVSWPVRTPRLTLRPATAADAEASWRWRQLPEVTRWITSAPDHSGFIAGFGDPERLSRTVMIEREQQPIGDLMISVQDAWAQTEVAERARGTQAELGWSLHPDWQGHGYASEAVRAAISLCFGTLGVRRLEASCFAENEASWRLMERVGMRREAHTLAESLHRDGTWRDGLTYALLASEWDVAKGQLRSAQ